MDFILGQLRMLGTVAVVMICALGGTVVLLKAIEPFAPDGGAFGGKSPPVSSEGGLPQAEEEDASAFAAGRSSDFSGTEREARADTIKDQMRRGIVEKSVQVLRRHGISEEEIRAIIEKDFHIDRETLDEILSTDVK